MAYAFEQEQSIVQNVNRILEEEITKALDLLEKPDQVTPETIHTIRKRIKKIRALLRLVRRELKEKDFKRQNSFYRSIGHQLSPLRDATVMIKTLEKLRQAQPSIMSTRVFNGFRSTLVKQQDRTTRDFFEDSIQITQVTNAFRQAPQRVEGFPKHRNGFRIIAPNLEEIYRKARKALQLAVRQPSIDHLHELRKEVKTLWYHTRLLQPIWPSLFKAYEHEFDRLGELLGDDHDLGVLAQLIESDPLLLPGKPKKEAVLKGIQEQRYQLQEQIYPLANRLLAEKPSAFVRRFQLHWKLWHKEASQKIGK